MCRFLVVMIFMTLISCKGNRKVVEQKTPIADSTSLVSMKLEEDKVYQNDVLVIEYLETQYDFINEKEKAQANDFVASVIDDNVVSATQKSEIINNDERILSILTEQKNQSQTTYLVNHYDLEKKKELKASDIFYPKMRLENLANFVNEKYPNISTNPTDEDYQNFAFDKEGNFTLYTKSGTKVELSSEEIAPFVSPRLKYSFNIPPRVDCGKVPCVALTFDDGPGAFTPKLLDILKEKDAKATFFVLGQSAELNPSVLQRMQREGHQVDNHSWNHKNLHKLSEKDIEFQINSTNDKVEEIIGERPTMFRPPYGNFNEFVKNNFGMPIILWSVDTYDWKNRNSNIIVEKISKASNGDIILLHDIHKTSVDAMPRAIEILQEKGYHLVTLDELFYGINIDNKVVHSRLHSY